MYITNVLILCMINILSVTPYPFDGDFDGPPVIEYFPMPESCKNNGMKYCFDNTNYPNDTIIKILENTNTLEVDNNMNEDLVPVSYSTRGGDTEYDCIGKANSDFIYYIVDAAGKDRVVVQLEGKFQQRFSVMSCQEEGPLKHRTAHISNITVSKYHIACQNRYFRYDFMVLSLRPDYNGNYQLEFVSLDLPVCCACTYNKS